VNKTLRRTVAIALLGSSALALPTLSLAADVTREDIVGLFQIGQIDKNHDHMVSKQEFMDMMSKAWDMEATQMKAKDGRMTADQYRAFSKMFSLDVGG